MILFRQFVFIFLFALPSYSQDKAYTIQIASTKSESEARAKVSKLERSYYTRFEDSKGARYRVRVGRFHSEAEAKAYAQKLQAAKKIQSYFIAMDLVPLKVIHPKPAIAKSVVPHTASRPLAPATTPSSSRHSTTDLITPNSTFTNDPVSFEYPVTWGIAAQHDNNDLFIFSPEQTSFISVSARPTPFTKITNETISTLLNTIKTTESITEVDINEQSIDNDAQFGRVSFRLKYNEVIYDSTLLLKLKAGKLIEISIFSPASNKTNVHKIVKQSIKF